MSLRKLKSILMVAAVILAVASCKKKDDEVEIVYVDGKLNFGIHSSWPGHQDDT